MNTTLNLILILTLTAMSQWVSYHVVDGGFKTQPQPNLKTPGD